MTEPKFTQGPWRAVKHTYWHVEEPDGALCTLEESANDEHDAKLIAAAPDLYQALYNVMLEFGPGTMSDAAFEGACLALAKARGQIIKIPA